MILLLAVVWLGLDGMALSSERKMLMSPAVLWYCSWMLGALPDADAEVAGRLN